MIWVGGNVYEVLNASHETTEYVRGEREKGIPSRKCLKGGREKLFFNIFHQAFMRVAAKERCREAEKNECVFVCGCTTAVGGEEELKDRIATTKKVIGKKSKTIFDF